MEWTTPDHVNGKIKEYVVHYGEIEEGLNDFLFEYFNAENCELLIKFSFF